MLFNSFEFILLFLPITLIVFFILGKKNEHSAAIFWLLIASLFFYGWWNPKYLLLISTSIIVNYSIGLLIQQYIRKENAKLSSRYLFIGISFNLLLLAYYKYTDFMIASINAAWNTQWHLQNIILPIGISFFTFQQIAYLIDTKNKQIHPHNFLHYSLFVSFFPQLIAGPIVHHRQILPQILKPSTYTPKASNIAIGFSIFTIGLFKKVIIADNLSLYVKPVFDLAEAGSSIGFFQAWAGVFAYSLQLYFDFSAYSDMAIGLAFLFGIILPVNFYAPYKATSIIGFWKRWHITLSNFLRYYVYIPLGGNKKGKQRRYINIMLTMLLGGLWHGAAWTFIVWGALHGLYILINHIWRKLITTPINTWWSVTFARGFVFILVSIAWVLFRADSFSGAIEMYKNLFDFSNILIEQPHSKNFYMPLPSINNIQYYIDIESIKLLMYLLLILCLLWALPTTYDLFIKSLKPQQYNAPEAVQKYHKKAHTHWQASLPWAAFISLLFVVSFMHLNEVSEFIYFRF